MAARSYSQVVVSGIQHERLVEDQLLASNQSNCPVLMHHCDDHPTGDAPDVAPSPGVIPYAIGDNLPGRGDRRLADDNDAETPMPVVNFCSSKSCKLNQVCTVRQRPLKDMYITNEFRSLSVLESDYQLDKPYNPSADDLMFEPHIDDHFACWVTPEFSQKELTKENPGSIMPIFCYERTRLLGLPLKSPSEYLESTHQLKKDVFERYFPKEKNGKYQLPSRVERMNMLRDMFQHNILKPFENKSICLVLRSDGLREDPFYRVFGLEKCDKCNKNCFLNSYPYFYLPLNNFCSCNPINPVVIDFALPYSLLLNYSESFQSLPYNVKCLVLELLGGSADSIWACGQLGPIRVKQLGESLRYHRELYMIFLINGLNPFIFSQKSFSDFLYLVYYLDSRFISRPALFAEPFVFYELIATAMRLTNLIPLLKAWIGHKEDDPFEKTILQIFGKEELIHEQVVTFPLPEKQEIAQAGLLQNHVEINTWARQQSIKIANFDRQVAQAIHGFVMNEEVWNWFLNVAQKFYPHVNYLSEAFRQGFVLLWIHYLAAEPFTLSFGYALTELKRNCFLHEVALLQGAHGLMYLGSKLGSLWNGAAKDFDLEEMQAGGLVEPFLNLFLPGSGKFLLKSMIDDLRLYSLARTFTQDLFGAVQAILFWIVSYFKRNVMGIKDEFESFISDVDNLQEVYYQEDGSTTSLRHQLVKDNLVRDRIMSLLTLGTQLRRRLEKTKASKELLRQVNDRLNKLNKIVSGSAATFVGAEGKIKPFTVYLYGEPGSGKSVMLPHLFADICYALGAQPFDKSKDMYVLTAKTGYHDQYAYQRFAIRNDVLQMKDDEQRVNEIYDLINMADETPYPLEIAQCEGKGQVYFTSPYLFMTSNFDLKFRTPELASHMTEPDALLRRMDMMIEVHKVDYSGLKTFDRSKMQFTIHSHRGQQERAVTWYGLVDAMVKQIVDQYELSTAVTSGKPTDYDLDQLERIRQTYLGNPMEVDATLSIKPDHYEATPIKLQKKVRFAPPQEMKLEREEKLVLKRKEVFENKPVDESRYYDVNEPDFGFSFSGVFSEAQQQDLVERTTKVVGRYTGDEYTNEDLSEIETMEEVESGVCELINTTISDSIDWLIDESARWIDLPEPTAWEKFVHKHRCWFPASIADPVSRHVSFYESYGFAIKCGVFASALLVGWGFYRMVAKTLIPQEMIQALGGFSSGGETEFPRNRPQRKTVRQKHFPRREFQQAGISEITGWQAPNGQILEQAIFKNLCVVVKDDLRVNGLFVADHVIMIPLHIFSDIENEVITLVLHGGVTIEICMAELEDNEIFIADKNHVVFINTRRWTRLYPQWSNITKFFADANNEAQMQGEWAHIFTYRSSTLSTVGFLQRLMAQNVAPASGEFYLKTSDGQKHLVEKSVRGRTNTILGDCGAPWVLDLETGARIVGIHISMEKTTMTGRATLVTKQMIRAVLDFFQCRLLPIAEKALEETEQKGTFELKGEQWFDCEESLIVDCLGQPNVEVHHPSRTTLATTVWRGVSEVTKVPSRLKEFKNPEGKIVKPTQVRFRKWIGKSTRIPVEKIRAVYPLLSQWYPRPPPDKRRVLTLEQAIFGEEDGINPSIEQNTSVGWPWKLEGRKRSEFFNIENRTITDECRAAVDRYLSGQMFDTVVLDSLKDERVKIAKWESGDTRVFTICDFTLNIALKMLFGDFVHYLQSLCHSCPVKIGISPLPNDWTKLYHVLTSNEGGLIAGDMSGWDHRCHFEVMMGVIDWVNEWYDDDYKDIRFELARMTFEPLHLCDGSLYRSRGGMPSGSYLTTPINSLAVLTYIYMFAQELYGEDLGKDNKLWLQPVVYGDDHVVAVAMHPEMNQISFCKWFEGLGIGYTDEHKEAPTRDYTTIDEVTFLKRRFVKRDGYVWGCLPEENLLEQIQWYRRSATQRKKSQQQLSEEMLDTVLSEFFFHGRNVYDANKKKLLDYAKDKACLDVSNGAPSYDFKWQQFMGDGKPTPITTLSLIPP